MPTVYGLWFLCSDLVYVILFPQLMCVLYYKKSNTYGSLTAYIIGLLLRLLGGEPLVSLPPVILYPFYSASDGVQLFPFRTLAMVVSFLTLILVSTLTDFLFVTRKLIPLKFDFFHCFDGSKSETYAKAMPLSNLSNASQITTAGCSMDFPLEKEHVK